MKYYSKIQQRFVDRDIYFDELLFDTLHPYNDSNRTTNKSIKNLDNIIK